MLLLKAGVIWLSDSSPVCHSDQHPWRHACADDMHDFNAWSCRSVWLAVSGDSMQTNVSVNTRKAMSKHGRQRASRAFNEERQINDTSDFTETFRCSLYRINQTTKNLQRGYGSCMNMGNACETDHWDQLQLSLLHLLKQTFLLQLSVEEQTLCSSCTHSGHDYT